LDADDVQFADGVVTREFVRHPGAVGVIAVDADDRVLLVQQYRHPVQAMLWEPPAGLLDVPGEPPLAAAQRELAEEAHYAADEWAVLVDAFTTPGMSDESIRIYLATSVRPLPGQRPPQAAEEREMPVRWVPFDEALGAVLSGGLHNPMAVMGLLAWAALRDGSPEPRPADAAWDFAPQHAR
jgi:ADP-ribose pyrophosphatase